MKLIVVSGQSGAGKSVALRVLEDAGYYCVDNLPVCLLDSFIQTVQSSTQNVAVSLDIRNLPDKPEEVVQALSRLKNQTQLQVVFLDANRETLLKRYSETRRVHPLSLTSKKPSLTQAIELEKTILSPLKAQADWIVDSSNQSLHELSESVRILIEGQEHKPLLIGVQSFGFKYGAPKDADYVFDVRFLPNPHWQPELRPFTGLDCSVKSYLEQQTEVIQLKNDIQSFIERWLPNLERNNRSYLNIAIGCTGGKHRSVYIAQQIGEYFQQLGKNVQINHSSLAQQDK